ncbi:MAG: alcohol dehydrogenase [Sphingobacteriia bacterium 35-40-8]|nr:MAG: alcohol dehydrogenase [Sphingobacteriia bacterium 35-40-8]HQR94314.1 zinc-binding alcohol dehydrogenase family protein [Sediminibacterium sp.]
MKALICKEPGVFEYQDLAEPKLEPGYTILSVKRVGVCGTDIHAFAGNQPFFEYPRILGHELACSILETTDPNFDAGELVTLIPYFNCGDCIACNQGKGNCCVRIKVFGVHIDGGMRQRIAVPNEYLIKSQGLDLDALALVEPLSIGQHAVIRSGLQKGDFALIVGAGPIGLGLMEMARLAGAEVIAMDVNESRLAICSQKFGIEHCINPAKEDAIDRLKSITLGNMPNIVFDASGSLKAINQAFQFLAHTGRYVLVGLQKEYISFSHPEFHKREASLMSSRNASKQDFDQVISYLQSGQVNSSHYITHRYDFEAIADEFNQISLPENACIKAIIELD